MGRVSSRQPDGSWKERRVNLAEKPAETVEDYRAAMLFSVYLLGPPTYAGGHASECRGCDYERDDVIRYLLDKLDLDNYEQASALYLERNRNA